VNMAMKKDNVDFLAAIGKILANAYFRRVAVVTHINADPDALASALLAKLLVDRLYGADADLIFPEGLSSVSKRLAERFLSGMEFLENFVGNYDLYLVVDSSSSSALREVGEKVLSYASRAVIIDHHFPPGDLVQGAAYVCVRRELACTNILLEAVFKAGIDLDRGLASISLAGILYDTGRFQRADPKTFMLSSKLLEIGVDYEEVVGLLQEPMSLSERVARLKAASRCLIIRVGDYIICGSHVSSHEASAARGLLSLGADVAVVVGGKRGEIRVSFRSTQEFYRNTGISLGRDIVPLLSDIMEGSGGGHATAAGFNGVGDVQKTLQLVLRLLSSEVYRRVFRHD